MLNARSIALTAALMLPAVATAAQDFDPDTYDGTMLSQEALGATVAAAKNVTPPKNGDTYVFAFANLQRDIPFGVLVENGIVANAERAGLELTVADNRLDGAKALANAQSFINRDVDFIIEFQTDAAFGPTIMNQINAAGIPVIA
ncbi:MAG: substrate-binding domain-containing protein, partial [Pseudomonadota bacterium]